MLTDLYPHQEAALQKLSNGKILWGGVGSGKTKVAVEYYMQRERPRSVYVITTAKKRDDFDWQQEFYEYGIGPATGPAQIPGAKSSKKRDASAASTAAGRDSQLGASSSGRRPGTESASGLLLEGDPQGIDIAAIGPGREAIHSAVRSGISDDGGVAPDARLGLPGVYPWVVTVDSWNNIAKYADVAGAFFIFDEQRLVGAGDWTRKFLRIAKRNRWILLTATPGDTWLDYIGVFVANGFYKNRTHFKSEHVVYNNYSKFPKVERYINVQKLYRHKQELLVEMKYERHTKRRHVEVQLPYDRELLQRVVKDRWNVFEDRPLRDVVELCTVSRRVVNGDPSRLEMVCELWKQHPKLIVFYNYNFELESLRSLKEYYEIEPIVPSSTRSSGGSVESSSTRIRESIGISSRSTGSGCGDTPGTSKRCEECEKEWVSSQKTETGSSPRTDGSSNGSSTSTLTTTGGLTSTHSSTTLAAGRSPNPSLSGTLAGSMRSTGSGKTSLSTAKTTSTGCSARCESSTANSSKPTSGTRFSTGTTRLIGSTYTSSVAERPISSTPAPSLITPSSMAISEWNGHKHQPIPQTERWLYLVQYTAGAEGWNCIETDAMTMYSANYSWKITEQSYGRIDRLNTPFTDLWYYGFTSDSWIDRAIAKALKAKGNFNENHYKGLFKGSK